MHSIVEKFRRVLDEVAAKSRVPDSIGISVDDLRTLVDLADSKTVAETVAEPTAAEVSQDDTPEKSTRRRK